MINGKLKRQALLSLTKRNKDNKLRFETRGMQRNIDLLVDVARQLVSKSSSDPDDVEAIVALGTSGIALGMTISYLLEKPLYFYKVDGWPLPLADYSIPHVLPYTQENLRVLLVDSHYRSGFSLLRAKAYLKERLKLIVVGTAVIFAPSTKQQITRDKATAAFIKQRQDSNLIKDSLGSNSLQSLFRANSNFWGFADILADTNQEQEPSEEDTEDYASSKNAVAGSLFYPDFIALKGMQPYSKELGSIEIHDPEIWKHFQNIELLKKITKAISQELEIEESYEAILGIGVLGTALAIALSLSGKRKLPVFSSQLTDHIVPVPKKGELKGKRVLLCNIRLTTGLPVSNAIKLLEAEEAVYSDLLALRVDMQIRPQRRHSPLFLAHKMGLKKIYAGTLTKPRVEYNISQFKLLLKHIRAKIQAGNFLK